MKKYFIILVLLPLGSLLSQVRGSYLGQSPPGKTPEIFAPGILSTGLSEIKVVFSPDGRELFCQLWGAPFPMIVTMEEREGEWSEPETATFSGLVIEAYNISPDGQRMFISSRAPLEGRGKPLSENRLRYHEKRNGRWGRAIPLDPSIQGYPAVAANGDLYLANGDLSVSRLVDGVYTEPVSMGDSINTAEFYEEDPYVAPDQSYILFCRLHDGFGGWDIFVSFRRDDGSWTRAKNLGEPVNSSATDVYPFVSADGKYLFYGSFRTGHDDYSEAPLTLEDKLRIQNGPGNGEADIYWVDAGVIHDLKRSDL